jgi:hypothetical protein
VGNGSRLQASARPGGAVMRVLVCGGRDFGDRHLFNRTISRVQGVECIIHGCARGADTMADIYAREWSIPQLRFPADWAKHGKAAGFIRNQQMLDEGRPTLVVAFPGGSGTADMVARARKAGVEVLEVVS